MYSKKNAALNKQEYRIVNSDPFDTDIDRKKEKKS